MFLQLTNVFLFDISIVHLLKGVFVLCFVVVLNEFYTIFSDFFFILFQNKSKIAWSIQKKKKSTSRLHEDS